MQDQPVHVTSADLVGSVSFHAGWISVEGGGGGGRGRAGIAQPPWE